jgi:signal transduction histidine kinase
MKRSLKSRYQILMIIFFAIFILESALILLAVIKPVSLYQLQENIHSIVILFIFILFVYFLVLFYYIPYKYEQGLKQIYQIMDEVSEGKYLIDLELKTHNQYDEIADLITAMQKMMSIVIRFDSLKADKIFEHHQRIQLLINMLPEGCLILSLIGEILYVNEALKLEFPELTEDLNIIETLLPAHIEKELKPLILGSLRNGENIKQKSFSVGEDGKLHYLSSSIVRNRKGQPVGAVFVITS